MKEWLTGTWSGRLLMLGGIGQIADQSTGWKIGVGVVLGLAFAAYLTRKDLAPRTRAALQAFKAPIGQASPGVQDGAESAEPEADEPTPQTAAQSAPSAKPEPLPDRSAELADRAEKMALALRSQGFEARQARPVVRQAFETLGPDASNQEILKECFRLLTS